MDQTPARQSGFWDGSAKVMFMMGLFLGIAIASTLGLGLVVGGVIKGGSASTTVADAPVAPTPSAPTPSQPNQPAAPSQAVKAVVATDHLRGNKNAKVTMIEYSDFECPFCKRFQPSIDQALKDFPNDVRLVYRQFPLRSIHQSAEKAAESSECAAKLGGDGAFWKMHDKLIDATTLSVDIMKGFAKDIGLNQAKFNDCLDKGDTVSGIDASLNEGGAAGVEGTPSTFVNGKILSGAVPYDGAGGLKAALVAAGAAK